MNAIVAFSLTDFLFVSFKRILPKKQVKPLNETSEKEEPVSEIKEEILKNDNAENVYRYDMNVIINRLCQWIALNHYVISIDDIKLYRYAKKNKELFEKGKEYELVKEIVVKHCKYITFEGVTYYHMMTNDMAMEIIKKEIEAQKEAEEKEENDN